MTFPHQFVHDPKPFQAYIAVSGDSPQDIIVALEAVVTEAKLQGKPIQGTCNIASVPNANRSVLTPVWDGRPY